MSNADFDDIIASGFTGPGEVSMPAQWRLEPPPSRKAVGISEVRTPKSGLPLILAYPAGDQRIWITDFVLYGHRIETVQLEGMTAPVPCVTVADAAGWEAAGYGYSAPTRLCPVEWAFTYIDQCDGQAQPVTGAMQPPILTPKPVLEAGSLLGRSVRCQMPYEGQVMEQDAWTWWTAITEIMVNPETGDRVVGVTSPQEWAAARYADPEPGLPHVWYCAIEEAWIY